MALSLPSEKIKDLFGKTVSTNIKILEAQTRFAEGFIKRSTAAVVEITDARISSLQELTSVKSFTEAYDNTLAFEGAVRDKVLALHEDNTAASKEFGQEVKTLLEIDEIFAKAKSVADDVSDKVKILSESTIAKARELSETAIAKTKDVSGNVVATARKFNSAEASVKAPVRKAAAATKKSAGPKKTSAAKKAPEASANTAVAPRKDAAVAVAELPSE